jgi:hypothetical protein
MTRNPKGAGLLILDGSERLSPFAFDPRINRR